MGHVRVIARILDDGRVALSVDDAGFGQGEGDPAAAR
jgi:hypothetical protein